MVREEVFTTIDLPVSGKCDILEGKGLHYFNAMANSKGDNSQLIKFLMLELVLVDGKKVTEEQLSNMHMRDVMYISEVINTMVSSLPEDL